MRYRLVILVALLMGLLLLGACEEKQRAIEVLATYSLDELDQGVDRDEELSIDLDIFQEGRGSLYIKAARARVVQLFELDQLDLENALLTWSARLKCISLAGNAYLEAWCSFPGEGEFFERGLETAVNRVDDWRESEVKFALAKGRKPDRIRLNIVLEGGGSVWVDDVKLTVGPLPQ